MHERYVDVVDEAVEEIDVDAVFGAIDAVSLKAKAAVVECRDVGRDQFALADGETAFAAQQFVVKSKQGARPRGKRRNTSASTPTVREKSTGLSVGMPSADQMCSRPFGGLLLIAVVTLVVLEQCLFYADPPTTGDLNGSP